MQMHILSDSQHKELSASLASIQSILDNSTNVVLDGKAAKPPVAKTTPVTKPARRKARGRGVSVLNETKVLEIKRQLASGRSAAKIAKDFGVHLTTINCIKWGKTWKHVSLQQDATPASVNV
jgi:hypothetical protein